MYFKKKRTLKRILAALSVSCILFVCFSAGTAAHAQSSTRLTASNVSAERGNTVSVALAINGNPGLWGIKLKIGYDKSALTLSSVANGTLFADGDVTLPETLDKEPFVYVATSNGLKDITANGTLVTLKFKVSENAAFSTYPITVSLTQAINVAGKDVGMDIQNGAITAVKCIHNKIWRTTAAAGYHSEGTETEVCSKCGEIFSTRPIPAISGSAPSIVQGNNLIFHRSSNTPLVFISNADFSTFLGVEIDGNTLGQNDYTAESGSTIVTISCEYLATLADGLHTVAIVSEEGTAAAEFTVTSEPKNSEGTDTSEDAKSEPGKEPAKTSNNTLILVVVLIVVLCVVGAAAFIIIKKRRK